MGTPGLVEAARQVDGGLPAELHDHAVGALALDDAEHVLEAEGLEVEAVGGVVVGGDGLGVAVDHDRLVAQLGERPAGLHAAVVELDALADAVGAAAQDDHLGPARGRRLVALLVVGVEVGRLGRELAGAGVDPVVVRLDLPLAAPGAHLRLG